MSGLLHHAPQETRVADREAVDDEQVQALLGIMWLWTCRDIRLVFSERQATDHRSKRPGRLDVEERHGQLQELNAGWFDVIHDDPAENPVGDLSALVLIGRSELRPHRGHRAGPDLLRAVPYRGQELMVDRNDLAVDTHGSVTCG